MARQAALIEDNELIYVIPIVVIGILFIVYQLKFEWIAMLWKTIRLGELYLLQWFPDLLQESLDLNFSKTLTYLKQTSSKDLHKATISFIDSNVFWINRFIPSAILIFLGIKLHKWSKGQTGLITPEIYLKEMGKHFDSTKNYININPSEHSIFYDFEKTPEENCFAMPIDIDDFVTCNPPLKLKKMESDRPIAVGIKWQDFDMSLARTSFERQLGRRLAGLNKLSQHETKLFKECAKAIPRKYRTDTIRALQARHAYVRTFMLGMLENARKFGVLPAHLFRFELKRSDRLLYLALSSLGVKMAKRPYVEIAGIMAHYQFEQRLGHSVTQPMVESCVTELQTVLEDMATGVSKNKRDESYDRITENLV